MTQEKLKQNTSQEKTPLCDSVLGRIESERVTPSSRFKFECMNYGVWFAWALSIIFGAISVAVLVYIGTHARFALHEATHETPISFFVEILPYVWIVTFAAMGACAYFNMRHTKCGYRYPVWQLLFSSVIFSVIGGVVLHVFGAGYAIDTQLGKKMPAAYRSLENAELGMWQSPSDGRLLGVFNTMDEADELYIFVDKDGQQWSIQTAELRTPDRELLSSGKTVRVLGTTTDTQTKLFHACGVFPWMYDKNASLKDMEQDRRVFVERMYEHMEKGDRLRALEKETFKAGQQKSFSDGLCAEIAVMKKMKF